MIGQCHLSPHVTNLEQEDLNTEPSKLELMMTARGMQLYSSVPDISTLDDGGKGHTVITFGSNKSSLDYDGKGRTVVKKSS